MTACSLVGKSPAWTSTSVLSSTISWSRGIISKFESNPNTPLPTSSTRARTERGSMVCGSSGVPTALRPGDRITVGLVQLQFRSDALLKNEMQSSRQTTGQVANGDFVMVVGDIVGFSTSSHGTPSRLVMESLESLLREFRTLLTGFHGTLSNFVGDAFFAIWELGFEDRAALGARLRGRSRRSRPRARADACVAFRRWRTTSCGVGRCSGRRGSEPPDGRPARRCG